MTTKSTSMSTLIATAASQKHVTLKTQRAKLTIQHFLISHTQAGLSSLGRMFRTPFTNFLTVLVIAIALALPTTLIVLLQNVQQASQAWNKGNHLSLFLKGSISENEAQIVAASLRKNPQIDSVKYISPEQGLIEFENNSGIGNVMSQLPANPLPGVLEIVPKQNLQTADDIAGLVDTLQQLPQIDVVQVDMAWLKRLNAILTLGQKVLYAFGILLALGVLLIIGNTIRLLIQNHHDEIVVIKLVGGTNRFVRRPFLYTGAFFGLLGGLFASIFVAVFFAILKAPVANLASLYFSQFSLHNLYFLETAMLLMVGTLLGIVGAWLAVGRQLRLIEPG